VKNPEGFILDDAYGRFVLARSSARRSRLTTTTLDFLLGCLTVLVLALGARGGLTSHRWATRLARSRPHIVLGLVPSIAVLALVIAFPDIAAS
jgi:hypothetical protein